MENVIVSLGRRTGPNVRHGVAQLLYVFQISEKNFVINSGTELSRPEEMNRVQVRNVHSSGVWSRTLRPVLLNVHSKEANVCAINLFKSE